MEWHETSHACQTLIACLVGGPRLHCLVAGAWHAAHTTAGVVQCSWAHEACHTHQRLAAAIGQPIERREQVQQDHTSHQLVAMRMAAHLAIEEQV